MIECGNYSGESGLFTPLGALDDIVKIHEVNYAGFAQSYEKDRFIIISKFLSDDCAAILLKSMGNVPSGRVRCGFSHVTWSEQNFEPSHAAHMLFRESGILQFVKTVSSTKSEPTKIQCWSSIYETGEYIDSHRDKQGIIQLLICLQAPSDPSHGGELVVGKRRVFLAAGDAIAFEATRLEHYTTPIVATAEEPNPRRVVLVGRYFFE